MVVCVLSLFRPDEKLSFQQYYIGQFQSLNVIKTFLTKTKNPWFCVHYQNLPSNNVKRSIDKKKYKIIHFSEIDDFENIVQRCKDLYGKENCRWDNYDSTFPRYMNKIRILDSKEKSEISEDYKNGMSYKSICQKYSISNQRVMSICYSIRCPRNLIRNGFDLETPEVKEYLKSHPNTNKSKQWFSSEIKSLEKDWKNGMSIDEMCIKYSRSINSIKSQINFIKNPQTKINNEINLMALKGYSSSTIASLTKTTVRDVEEYLQNKISRKKWSKDEEMKVLDLYKNKKTIQQLSTQFGRTENAIILKLKSFITFPEYEKESKKGILKRNDISNLILDYSKNHKLQPLCEKYSKSPNYICHILLQENKYVFE